MSPRMSYLGIAHRCSYAHNLSYEGLWNDRMDLKNSTSCHLVDTNVDVVISTYELWASFDRL